MFLPPPCRHSRRGGSGQMRPLRARPYHAIIPLLQCSPRRRRTGFMTRPHAAWLCCSSQSCCHGRSRRCAGKRQKSQATNRLAKESSPYLLQHATIRWTGIRGDRKRSPGRKKRQIVFLSIGYSSCHWCHVMETRVVRERGGRQAAQQELRLHQSRSRGAAGRRSHLHDRPASCGSAAVGRCRCF